MTNMTDMTGKPSQSTLAEIEDQIAAQTKRREIARLGGYAMHAQHDGKTVATRGMDTRMRRYRERLDPTGELAQRDPQALAKRVEAALKFDMAKVREARSMRISARREEAKRQQAREQRTRAAVRSVLMAALSRTPPDRIPASPRSSSRSRPSRTHRLWANKVNRRSKPPKPRRNPDHWRQRNTRI